MVTKSFSAGVTVVVHSKVHHLADDSKFLYASHSLKNLNKTINFDLSNLVQQLKSKQNFFEC